MFVKKTWQNRVTQYPTRRVLTEVSGENNTYEVTRAEGTITAEGDAFSAENMNDLEDRIFNALGDKATFRLEGTTLYITTE